jgi:hypothetical protein
MYRPGQEKEKNGDILHFACTCLLLFLNYDEPFSVKLPHVATAAVTELGNDTIIRSISIHFVVSLETPITKSTRNRRETHL